MEKPAPKVYDLKLLVGQTDLLAPYVSKEIIETLCAEPTVRERYESFDEAKEALDEYRSITRKSVDENAIIIEAYALEEMVFEAEEYVSSGLRIVAPFDENSIITEEVSA